MEEKTNKAKLEIFTFLRKTQKIFEKKSHKIIITIFGDENSAKSYGFHENAKIIENHLIFVNSLRFSLKILSRLSESQGYSL